MGKTLRNQLLVFFIGLLILLFGIWLGGHPSNLPGFINNLFVEQSSGHVYDEALSRIQSDYYHKVDSKKLINTAIAADVASLNDPFSAYYTPKEYKALERSNGGEYQGIGVILLPVKEGGKVIAVYQNSPAKRAGIKEGDIFTAVNGRSIAGKSALHADQSIRGKAGTAVTLTVLSQGKERTLKIYRGNVTVPLVTSHMRTANGVKVGYVTLSQFGPGAAAQVRANIDKLLKRGAQGIVLDLRDNPGGLIQEALGITSIFIPGGKTVVTTKGRTVGDGTYTSTGGAIKSGIPVAVLVNRLSASSAEIVSSALQDYHRAVIVGQHTFGKGVFQEMYQLSNGGAVELVAGEYFTPNGRNLGGGGIKRGAGVKPNVAVANPPSGKDQQLAVALKLVADKVKK